jgi:hypothetical protein
VKRVITAAEVEAAAANGNRQLVTENGALLTPLARDRAAAVGLAIVDGPAPVGPGGVQPSTRGPRPGRATASPELDVKRLAVESKVRVAARRVLLRAGRSPGELEDVVQAVMRRLDAEAGGAGGCGCAGCDCGSTP